MKIFLCIKNFFPDHTGGTEVYVLNLGIALKFLGHEVSVLKPNYKNQICSGYDYQQLHILEYAESEETDRALQLGQREPVGIKNFESILLKEKPHVVHFHEINGSNGFTIFHLKAAAALDIKVFTTLHLISYVCKAGTLSYMDKTECDGVINRKKCASCLLSYRRIPAPFAIAAAAVGNLIYPKDSALKSGKRKSLLNILKYPAYIDRHERDLADIFSVSKKVFILNDWFKDILLKNKLPEDKMIVVRAGYSPVILEEHVIKINADNSEIIKLVYIGRICAIKGLKEFLKAFLTISNFNITLDIYGSVSEQQYYEDCIAMTERSDNIKWCGVLKPEEVMRTMQNYDLLIFPTRVEEMSPMVLEEAMQADLPFLAPNINATRAVISRGAVGWLFDFKNNQSLQNKFMEIIENKGWLNRISAEKSTLPAWRELTKIHADTYSAS